MHIIPLVTIPSSGTHFMAAFFRGFNIVRAETDWETLAKEAGRVVLRPDIATLIRGHIGDKTLPYIKAYAEHWTPIVPLRDPLLQFIAYRNLNGTAIASHILPMWRLMVEEMPQLGSHFVPIDLLRDVDERGRALRGVLHAAKLQGTPEARGVVQNWAANWPMSHNAQPLYTLKVAYVNRDRPFIKRHLETEWPELVAAEDWLRPFLAKRGYSELLWWNE